jgi:ABC-type multidrug transport system fused ATPase/permease subunit
MSVLSGAVFFGVEFAFAFIIQGFLVSIKVANADVLALPSWYPREYSFSMLVLVLYGVVKSCISVLNGFLIQQTEQTFIQEQKKKVLAFAINNVSKVSTHEVNNIFMERIGQAASMLGQVSPLIVTFTTSFLFAITLAKLSPKEFFLSLALMVTLVVPSLVLVRRARNFGKGLVKDAKLLNKSLIHGIKYNFFLKIFSLIDDEVRTGFGYIDNYKRHTLRFAIVNQLMSVIPNTFGIIIVSFVTFIGLKFFNSTPSQVLIFLYLFMRFAQTCSDLNAINAKFNYQREGLWYLFSWYQKNSLLDMDISKYLPSEESKKKVSAYLCIGNIEASNLSFGFSKDSILFKDLFFKISKGDVLLIKGVSGSGKSTLLSIILGLHKPITGFVKYDGMEIEEHRSQFVRSIAYVGPEPYMIPGTVRENLLFGYNVDRDITDEEIFKALELACVKSEVMGLENKLDEELNEYTQLSTGQKQRISIARAFLRKADLVILDEATANIDHNTEMKLIDSILKLMSKQITIVVSHKPTFDKIATMKIEMN